MRRWLGEDTRSRRLALALGVYVVCTAVYFAVAAPNRITSHTQFNHYTHLARGWLDGHLDLGRAPPGYAANNDFASFEGKWYVTFPPLPAVLLAPLVKIAGAPERVQDGQFFLWLAGIGPAVLFLALEKLRKLGKSERPLAQNLLLTALFAFGSVYFFTAEQGTVWFAAHVVGVALVSAYLLFALDAERPLLAGLMLGLGALTRPTLLFAAPLLVLEALRVARRPVGADGKAPIDWRRLSALGVLFALPIAACLALSLWHNWARFHHAFEPGYRFLTVGWKGRIEKWGLFDDHYLAKNLGVMLTSLPWVAEGKASAPFQVNSHGLALWFTTPLYFWLLWPKRCEAPHRALWLTVAAVALPSLFYQNTGWLQFGYRFSNDYSPFLFALLAIGGRSFGSLFAFAAAWSVSVNAFGAATFDRAKFARFYYQEASQGVVYQPD